MVVGACVGGAVVTVVVVMEKVGVKGSSESKFNFSEGIICSGVLDVKFARDWMVYGLGVGNISHEGTGPIGLMVIFIRG